MKDSFQKIKNWWNIFVQKIYYKFSDQNQKPYKLKKINPIKKAKAMDLVIELCMGYYIHKENKIDFYKIEGKLNDNLGLHSWESEFLLRVMSEMGYIKEVFKENNDIDKIYCTPKGIEVFINGGFKLEAKRKRGERRLIRAGQYISIIIGLYSLAKFLKEYLGVTLELLKCLICKTDILPH